MACNNEEHATEEPQQTVTSLRQMFEARSARAIGRRPSPETAVLPAISASLAERRSFFETNRNADVVVSPRPPAMVDDESLSPDALSSVGSRIMALRASVERSEPQANLRRRRPKAFDVSDEDLPSVKARSRFFETAEKTTAKVSRRKADKKRVADLEFEQSLQRFREFVESLSSSIDPDSECIPETE